MRELVTIRRVAFALLCGLAFAPGLAVSADLEVAPTEISGGAAMAGELQKIEGSVGPQATRRDALAPEAANSLIGGPGFEGFDFDDNATESGGFLFIPPDPIAAAGTDRIVAVTNTMVECRDKTGALLWRDSLKDMFAPAAGIGAGTLGTFTFDPKVVWDPYEGRFVVVTLERWFAAFGDPSDESRILLAVSKGPSPATPTAADWEYHSIDSKIFAGGIPHWADYPGFEVDEEAVYVHLNMFSFPGFASSFENRLWIVDKGVAGGFYAGGPAGVTVHNPPGATGGIELTHQPAQISTPGGAGPGIGTYLVGYSSLTTGGPGGLEAVQVIRVNDPLGATSFTHEFVFVGDIEDVGGGFGFPPLPDAPQAGTGETIEVNDSRTLDAVWENGNLWITTTINPNGGPDVGQTTAHWFKLDTSAVTDASSAAGLITLGDQGDIGGEDVANDTYTYFPSVAVNSAGEVKFGFSASASTIFAGAFVTGRQPGDAAGTVHPSQTVRAGDDFYIRTFDSPPCSATPARNRWGDYSGISVDPADNRVFWVFNEYAAVRGTGTTGGCNGRPSTEDGRWGTYYMACSFSCFDVDCPGQVMGAPGEQVVFDVCITNCGGLEESFNVVVSDPNNFCTVSPSMVTVQPDGTECVQVTCTIPDDQSLCMTQTTITIVVSSKATGETFTCATILEIDCPVPTRLNLAVAERDGGGAAVLEWEVTGDDNPFHVYREVAPGSRVQVSDAPVYGEAGHYRFVDATAPPSRVDYWLEELTGASPILHGPITLEASSPAPSALSLAPAQPNPFSGRTQIAFSLPSPGPVRLAVFDGRGRKVATLAEGAHAAGPHVVSWDGRTDAGARATIGLYVVQLQAGDRTLTRKLVLTR